MARELKTAGHCKALPRRLVIAVLALMLPLFFIGGPDWSSGPLEKALWNLGHPVFFGLLVAVAAPRLPLRGVALWLATTAAVLVAGLAIELLQGPSRTLDWRDLGRNLIGAWIALAWCRPAGPAQIRHGLKAFTLLLLVAELMAIGQVGWRQFQLAQQLPVLFDFRHDELAPYWSGQGLGLSDHLAAAGSHSLAIDLDTRPFSGVTLHNLPQDWRGYQALILVLYNPQPEPLALTLRIHDTRHDRGPQVYSDRFNRRLVLAPGRNRKVIPLAEVEQAPAERTMDMARIRRLGLFATALPAPRRVYLLELQLDSGIPQALQAGERQLQGLADAGIELQVHQLVGAGAADIEGGHGLAPLPGLTAEAEAGVDHQ